MLNYSRWHRFVAPAVALCATAALTTGCGKAKESAENIKKKVEEGAKEAAKAAAGAAEKVADKAAEAKKDDKGGDEAPVVDVPAPKLVPAGESVDFAEVKKDAEKFKGKTLLCRNLLSPSPMALSPFGDKKAVALIKGEVDDRRTTFFCRTKEGGLRSTPVSTYFPKGKKGELLHIDRETEVNIEVQGKNMSQVVGLYKGIVKAPRKKMFMKKAPDLMSGLLWPEKYAGKTVTCTSKLSVSPKAVQRFDKKAADLAGGEMADKKALVRCEDMRGGSVGLILFFPKDKAGDVLKIGRETKFTATIKGFERNQLVAVYGEIKSGAIEGGGAGDLKAVLLDAKPHIGKEVSCESITAPTPSAVGMLDRKAQALLKPKTDDYKASLMCKQASGGSVTVKLFFEKGKKEELLKIASHTKVKFSIWGVVSNRLVGLYTGIESGGVEAGGPQDWRRVALMPKKFQGKVVPCEINLKPFVSKLKVIGSSKKALLRSEKNLADKHGVITCKDNTGGFGGTRVEAYFTKANEGDLAKLARGDKIKMKVVGAAYSTLVAVYAGK